MSHAERMRVEAWHEFVRAESEEQRQQKAVALRELLSGPVAVDSWIERLETVLGKWDDAD